MEVLILNATSLRRRGTNANIADIKKLKRIPTIENIDKEEKNYELSIQVLTIMIKWFEIKIRDKLIGPKLYDIGNDFIVLVLI